jgi:hypothetical protein
MFAGSRRSNKRLEAKRFELDQNVFDELRELCEPVATFVRAAHEKEYQQFGAVERGEEFFSYDISGFRRRPSVRPTAAAMPGSPEDDTADLVRIVRTVDALEPLGRADIDAGGFSFYGICWPHDDTMIGFVSRNNPTRTLRPGLRYFRYSDRLRRAEHPDLELREGADLVVGIDRIAILREAAFSILLGDVGVIFAAVPGDVDLLQVALASTIPLTSDSMTALATEGTRLLSYARRLRALPTRLRAMPNLTIDTVRRSMAAHGIPEEMLIKDGKFAVGVEHVELFLDMMEGRYFEDDLSDEPRRADRFSHRPSK